MTDTPRVRTVVAMEDLPPAVLGRRVAELRRRAGVTQEGLALRLHRSVSWVKKIEQGRRPLDNVRTLVEVAAGLGVELRDLREDLDPSRPGYGAVPALRRALTASRSRVEPRPVGDLRDAVIAAGDRWQAEPRCYSEVAPLLPPLIEESHAAVDTATGEQRRAALSVLALACQVGQEVAARLGEPDLAWISARLAADAAAEVDDATLVAVGAWRMAHAALRFGQLDETRDLAADRATALAPFLRDDPGPAELSAYGALRLVGAVAAARSGDGADAAALLSEARATAERLGTDTNLAWQTFGPANTGVHETAVALELGDRTGALRAARRVNVRSLLTGERRATHHLQIAHALAHAKRDGEALHHVLAAERFNPEGLPHDTLARELVAGLVRRDRRRSLTGLRDLARRLRVLDP
jgi:transcriptional regulator with XRE-family HTH domain